MSCAAVVGGPSPQALFGELPAFETNALVSGPLLSQAGETRALMPPIARGV